MVTDGCNSEQREVEIDRMQVLDLINACTKNVIHIHTLRFALRDTSILHMCVLDMTIGIDIFNILWVCAAHRHGNSAGLGEGTEVPHCIPLPSVAKSTVALMTKCTMQDLEVVEEIKKDFKGGY